MADRKITSVTFTAPQKVELIETDDENADLAPDGVAGRTLVSLISPGTELNDGYLGYSGRFPRTMGYAAVFTVDEVGSEVTDMKIGDLAFAMGPHKSYQRVARQFVLALPSELSAQVAVFARVMGISMTTLVTTRVRPGSRVLISGLGPVGHFAAKIFALCGYRVTAVDPVASRRQLVDSPGIEHTCDQLDLEDESVSRSFALAVECSGHEQAVLAACTAVRKGGEVVMIGVPWRKRSDMFAQTVLHAVFFGDITLRGGSEWTIPRHPLPFVEGSNFQNFQTALQWLADGKVRVDDLYQRANPADAQQVYEDLLNQRTDKLTTMFDWSQVG